MAERSVAVRFDANVTGYMAGIAKMQTATANMAAKTGESMTKNKAVWDGAAKGMMVGGLALGAVLVGAAKAFMEFDAAMSGVAAVANATAKEQAALGKAAIQAGQDTVFSATEAANAEAELAKAGVSVSDIMGGALKGSLDLAAAGQIDLAKAAEISAQAMNIFNLEGKDVGHIADVLTAGANKSAAGVDDLGMALSQGGLVAAQMGWSLEETVASLSMFADAGLKGSDAGTSLKTAMQRLANPSAEAAAAMKQYGINAFDAQGNTIGLAELSGQLATGMGDLDVKTRNAALATIFGSDAVRAAAVWYNNGAKGAEAYKNGVIDAGAAARMAARQTDNLKGDLEQLKGTLESAFINAGSGGNEGLRGLVKSLTGMVDGFNKLSPAAQSAAFQIAAVTAAALLVGGAGIKAATSIAAMKVAMDGAALSGGRLATVMKGLGAAAAVGGVAMVALELGKIGPAAATADVGVRGLVSSVGQLSGGGRLTGGIADLFREDNGIFGSDEKWVSAGEAVKRFSVLAYNAFSEDFSAQARRIQDFGASTAKMDETIRKLDGSLAELVRGGNADQAKASLEALLKGISDPAVREQTRAQFTALQAALDETAVSAAKAGTEIDPLTGKTKDAGSAAQQAADDTKAWADALNGLNSPMLDAREAARQFEEAIDGATEAVKKNGKTLKIGTEAGRKNEAALDAVAKAALDQIGALQANGASQGQLQSTLSSSRSSLIKTAEKFGMSKREARAYADQVLAIPKARDTKVTINAVAAKTAAQRIQSYINGIHGKDVRINVRYNAGKLPNGGRDLTGGITKAAGGPVYGPGTATSDSIPARLSNGEHVLTASDVDKAGGQGAIYRMRTAIQSGLLRFAGGGAVPAKFADGGAVGFAAGGAVDLAKILQIAADLAAAKDKRSITDRTLTAASSSNRSTKAFLDNVDKLSRMGFKTLALSLLDQGGPEAESIAAQAVKSASKAKALQTQLSSAAALSDREAAIRAALTGTSAAASLDSIALNGLGTYNPVRDLGPIARAGTGRISPVSTVSIRIDGALDPVSVGAQVEKVLQTYTSVTGRPLQVVTA